MRAPRYVKRHKKGKIDSGTGTRSKYESKILKNLVDRGVSVGYETKELEYEDGVKQGYCTECGSRKVHQKRKYTPDFVVQQRSGGELIIEAKGYFKSTDRSKMRAVLKSHPNLNIKMMFMTDGKIDATTRYSDWCEKFGMDYCIGTEVPESWLK